MTNIRSLFAYGALALFSSSAVAAKPMLDRLSAFQTGNGPGGAILVMRDGKILREEGFGYADREKKVLNTPLTSFNLASNSKQFTAMIALLLESQGKLKFDDPVAKYLPELPAYAKPIQVKHLLFHTAGLPDYMELCFGEKPVTNAEVLALLGKKSTTVFPVGTKFEYSNTGYVVLSEVLVRAGGKPYPELVDQMIFQPLGMKDARVLRADGKDSVPRRAFSYSAWPFLDRNGSVPCDRVYGDGGVQVSLRDYAKWLKSLVDDKTWPAGVREKIFKMGTTDDGKGIDYGYGWGILDLGRPAIGHTGSWNGFKSFAGWMAERKTWIVILANYQSIPLNDLILETAMLTGK